MSDRPPMPLTVLWVPDLASETGWSGFRVYPPNLGQDAGDYQRQEAGFRFEVRREPELE